MLTALYHFLLSALPLLLCGDPRREKNRDWMEDGLAQGALCFVRQLELNCLHYAPFSATPWADRRTFGAAIIIPEIIVAARAFHEFTR